MTCVHSLDARKRNDTSTDIVSNSIRDWVLDCPADNFFRHLIHWHLTQTDENECGTKQSLASFSHSTSFSWLLQQHERYAKRLPMLWTEGKTTCGVPFKSYNSAFGCSALVKWCCTNRQHQQIQNQLGLSRYCMMIDNYTPSGEPCSGQRVK